MNTLRFNAIAAALAASFSMSATVAHAAAGDFDPSFGAGGFVMTAVQDLSGADGLVIDGKNRVLVAGSSSNLALSTMSPTLLRYLPDGSVDTTFGDSGLGIAFVTPPSGVGGYADFCCVKLDSKNRIVAAGFTQLDSPAGGTQQVLTVVRFSEDGIVDRSFGTNGFITNVVAGGETLSLAQSLALDASDRVIVGGATFDASAIGTPVLIRYTADGALDHAFGKAGVVAIPELGVFAPAPVGVAIDSAGHIVAAGSSLKLGSGEMTYVARYEVDGSADTTFGSDGSGIVEVDGATIQAFVLDDADRPVVAGMPIDGTNMGMMRFTSEGLADPAFGPDGSGIVTTPADTFITPHAIAIDKDGNIVMSALENDFSSPTSLDVLRYTADGLLDTSFGSDGIAKPELPEGAVGNGVAIDAANTITIAGYATDDASGQFQLTAARLQN